MASSIFSQLLWILLQKQLMIRGGLICNSHLEISVNTYQIVNKWNIYVYTWKVEYHTTVNPSPTPNSKEDYQKWVLKQVSISLKNRLRCSSVEEKLKKKLPKNLNAQSAFVKGSHKVYCGELFRVYIG